MQLKGDKEEPRPIVVSTMTSTESFAHSPNGLLLAVATNDGRLIVFDTKTGQQKNEFVPSAHLSAACSCLAWMPALEEVQTPSKKSRKRKSSLSLNGSAAALPPNSASPHHQQQQMTGNAKLDTIALGTNSGSILIYSLKTNDVISKLDNQNGTRINAIVWCKKNDILAGYDDGQLATFCAKKPNKATSSFQANSGRKKEAIHSLALHESEESIFVGTVAKIALWDLKTKAIITNLTGGHVGPVNNLKLILPNYLLSSGHNEQDHTVSLWKLSKDEAEQPDIVRLSANESVKTVFGSTKKGDTSFLAIGAITQSGILHYYEHNVEAAATRRKKPTRPKASLQIAAATDRDKANHKVTAIPILDAMFAHENECENVLNIVHGSYRHPTFESVRTDELDKLTCLVRPVTLHHTLPSHADVASASSVVVPNTASAVVLAPGPTLLEKAAGGTKRKTSESGKGDAMSMVDRLKLLSHDTEQKTTPPRTDSVLQLLLQGLHGRDRKILDSVLDRADEELITNTVKRLPVEAVLPLIEELQHYIKGRGMVNQAHAKWLKSVVQIHTAHLMSTPRCEEILGPVYAMIEARTKNYNSLLQLKGKLDMMTKQITAKPEEVDNMDANKEALLVYQDDSDDDLTERMDEMLMPASDTDDNWNQEEDDDDEENENENDSADEDDDEIVLSGDHSDDEQMPNGLNNGGSESDMDME